MAPDWPWPDRRSRTNALSIKNLNRLRTGGIFAAGSRSSKELFALYPLYSNQSLRTQFVLRVLLTHFEFDESQFGSCALV
jgi:hypothetical protein